MLQVADDKHLLPSLIGIHAWKWSCGCSWIIDWCPKHIDFRSCLGCTKYAVLQRLGNYATVISHIASLPSLPDTLAI